MLVWYVNTRPQQWTEGNKTSPPTCPTTRNLVIICSFVLTDFLNWDIKYCKTSRFMSGFKGVFEGLDLVLTFRGLVVIGFGLGAREWIWSMKVPTEEEREKERACGCVCVRARSCVHARVCVCLCKLDPFNYWMWTLWPGSLHMYMWTSQIRTVSARSPCEVTSCSLWLKNGLFVSLVRRWRDTRMSSMDIS